MPHKQTTESGRPSAADEPAWAHKVRLVALWWLAQSVVAWIVGAAWWVLAGNADPDEAMWGNLTWDEFLRTLIDADYLLWTGGVCVAMALFQSFFLWPVRRPSRRDRSGVPIWTSLLAAGFALACLATGAVLSVIQFLYNYAPDDWPVANGMETGWFVTVVATSWLIGGLLIAAFCRPGASRETFLARLASRLFLGTIIEAAAIIPLDVLVRKRENCYCWAGTYIALVICGALGLALFGPVIVLPVLVRRRKRWYAGHCDACGYDMSAALASDRCPECGAGWRPE